MKTKNSNTMEGDRERGLGGSLLQGNGVNSLSE